MWRNKNWHLSSTEHLLVRSCEKKPSLQIRASFEMCNLKQISECFNYIFILCYWKAAFYLRKNIENYSVFKIVPKSTNLERCLKSSIVYGWEGPLCPVYLHLDMFISFFFFLSFFSTWLVPRARTYSTKPTTATAFIS